MVRIDGAVVVPQSEPSAKMLPMLMSADGISYVNILFAAVYFICRLLWDFLKLMVFINDVLQLTSLWPRPAAAAAAVVQTPASPSGDFRLGRNSVWVTKSVVTSKEPTYHWVGSCGSLYNSKIELKPCDGDCPRKARKAKVQ